MNRRSARISVFNAAPTRSMSLKMASVSGVGRSWSASSSSSASMSPSPEMSMESNCDLSLLSSAFVRPRPFAASFASRSESTTSSPANRFFFDDCLFGLGESSPKAPALASLPPLPFLSLSLGFLRFGLLFHVSVCADESARCQLGRALRGVRASGSPLFPGAARSR